MTRPENMLLVSSLYEYVENIIDSLLKGTKNSFLAMLNQFIVSFQSIRFLNYTGFEFPSSDIY